MTTQDDSKYIANLLIDVMQGYTHPEALKSIWHLLNFDLTRQEKNTTWRVMNHQAQPEKLLDILLHKAAQKLQPKSKIH